MNKKISFVLFLLFTSQIMILYGTSQSSGKDFTFNPTIKINYTEENPIEITDNTGLSSYSSDGDGSSGNPYILSGMNISTTSTSIALYIHGSSVTDYFSIENNYFNASIGIQLEDLPDGIATIYNNTFINCNDSAIFIDNSEDVVVDSNIITDSVKAVRIEYATRYTLIGNTVQNCVNGFYPDYTVGYLDVDVTVNISENTFQDIKEYAIFIYKNPYDNVADTVYIKSNSFDNTTTAMRLRYVSNTIISNNHIVNVNDGILVFRSDDVTEYSEHELYGNTISQATNYAIELEKSGNATVEGTTITDASHGVIMSYTNNITAIDNEFNLGQNEAVLCYESTNLNIIDNVFHKGFITIDGSTNGCEYVNIKYNTFDNVTTAIDSQRSNHITIEQNSFINSPDGLGIDIYTVSYLNIFNNSFIDIEEAMKLYAPTGEYVANVNIESNVISINDNAEAHTAAIGFSGRNASNCSITKNIIYAKWYGIEFHNDGTDITIAGNKIQSDTSAMTLRDTLNLKIVDNTFTLTSFESNALGIAFHNITQGTIINNTFFDSSEEGWAMYNFIVLHSDSSDNEVYENHFLSKRAISSPNTNNYYYTLAHDEGTNNIWYNTSTSTGNYWCNLNDTTYTIDGSAGSVDLYPITYADTDGDLLDDYLENVLYETNPAEVDTDSDGMGDGFEALYGFDPLTDDGSEDADEDDLSNADEYTAGTNPLDADTDNDSMPDGYEVDYGLDPLVDDANGDLDSDNITNVEEYYDGTAPNNPDTDGDGYSDYEEKNAGTDPLDPTDYPEEEPTKTSYFFVLGLLSVVCLSIVVKKQRN